MLLSWESSRTCNDSSELAGAELHSFSASSTFFVEGMKVIGTVPERASL